MLVERLARTFVLGLIGAGAFASCSLDERALTAGSSYAGFWILGGAFDDDGGADSGGADHAGDNGGSDASGASPAGGNEHGGTTTVGGAAGAPAIVDGCPDLDHNDKGDCKETLVENANFAADTQSWSAGDDAFIEWSTVNHFDDLPSGSALVSANGVSDVDGMVQRAATQCVNIGGAPRVQVFANAFSKSGQGEGMASIGIFFYASTDCSGPPSGPPLETPGTLPDIWQTLSAKQAVPEGTQSALVRLAVSKPFRSAVFKAYFDNILLRTD